MGEVYWKEPWQSLPLPKGTIYAQTFSPLWSHSIDKIRCYIKYVPIPSTVKVSIQYLKPDGTPTGADLTSYTFSWDRMPPGRFTNVRQRKVPPIRIVRGINYAFCIERLEGLPTIKPSTAYIPPPSGYSRGKLIKSTDGGTTWDTTDLGDMLFGEYGYPPATPNRYVPPIEHWAITSTSQVDYNSNACLRVATTDPCVLTCYVSDTAPTPIERLLPVRGTRVLCLHYYSFIGYRDYAQKEDGDSLYHTFFLTHLKKDKKYWFCFTGESDFHTTASIAPIFERLHPEAPPFTTIRRPDAPGDVCTIMAEIGDPCPDHYLNVDESTPDEDTTCVFQRFAATSSRRDLYQIPDLLPADVAPIDKVRITVRVRRQGGYAYAGGGYLVLKTHGTEYQSPHFQGGSTSYHNINWDVSLNPNTGLPWTTAEINALQIGVRLECYWGVGWRTDTYCTQVYCRIYHQCEAYN